MRLIVVDLDRVKFKKSKNFKGFREERILYDRIRKDIFDGVLKGIYEGKICTIERKDFGKKTLLSVPKNDPEYLKASKEYRDAIFKLKDEGAELQAESRMFRKVLPKIDYFRIGVILRREKAVKILARLLGVA